MQLSLEDEAEIRLRDINRPSHYKKYHTNILNEFKRNYELCSIARSSGIDVSNNVESKIAYDLADRVAKMHGLDIADRLRNLLSKTSKEKAALKISEEIAIGEFGDDDLKTRLDSAVRVSLAVVTEGVTVAPLQGISGVNIKDNADGSKYLSVSFAGPIRSAGGTEAALTMIIADHVRKVAKLEKYKANSFDDETGRFVEELRIYEREVGNFQFKVLDDDVTKCIRSLPVELDGVDTDPVEVVGHKEMKRISTDRVRGGALRVMNDGIIGRSRKLLKLVESLHLEGWEWLKELKGAIQTGDNDDAVHHRMSEVITGRPVLSMTKKIGGFRLRYGRCYNTGFSTIGIHPVVPILLNYAIVVGTQIKIDTPGKAATIALVDTIEPPFVRLDDGSCMYISTIEQATKLQKRIDKILYLGDILISYGDFLENNAKLLPASYVEEFWIHELKSKLEDLSQKNNNDISNDSLKKYYVSNLNRLVELSSNSNIIPTAVESFDLSEKLQIPLHPKYLIYWDCISIKETEYFIKKIITCNSELLSKLLPKIMNQKNFVFDYQDNVNHDNSTIKKDENNNNFIFTFEFDQKLKTILEKLAITHSVIKLENQDEKIIEISDFNQIYVLTRLLFSQLNYCSHIDKEDYCYSIDDFNNYYDNIIKKYVTSTPTPSSVVDVHPSSNRSSNSNDNDYDEDKLKHINKTIDFISKLSQIEIRSKFSSAIAVRVGRPEKAAERKMKPPVHTLFPIGSMGGATRDILKAAKNEIVYTEIANRFCNNCKYPSIGTKCRICNNDTLLENKCIVCRELISIESKNSKCNKCGKEGKTYSPVNYPLKKEVSNAEKYLGIKAKEPLKGVKLLMSKSKSAEPIEKGILRQQHSLYTFKDGTIRFDATNEPITHFKPRWIGIDIDKIKSIGYTHDYQGNEIVSPDQIIEIMIQDVIIPIDTANHLLKVSQYVDDELEKLYRLEKFYNSSTINDLVGQLIIGLAPHTSVGIVGRIIGFTNSQVCLGSPVWHSAKRRDCDGDADSVMLLMDAFLNFSNDFLPDKIGGLMDAPLLIQPLVFPHEVQRQAHNVDIVSSYPLKLYQKSITRVKAEELSQDIEIIKNRIGSEQQFYNYYFTHNTNMLTTEIQRSAYSRLNTMNEKLDMQITTAKRINAVDPDEVVSMVLTTHILPDIMGNMRSYSSQAFRCTKCGDKYRRIPVIGKCLSCGNTLIQTVTKNSVEKYVNIAINMSDQFSINDYLSSRIETLIMELKYVFGEEKKEQHTLMDFINQN